MKKYILRSLFFILLFLGIGETLSRLFIDPYYFYSLNTYNLKKQNPSFKDIYTAENTAHVDFLFIGSSRVPATINPSVFMERYPGKVAVVAGRGYMTAGIHYQALTKRIQESPEYLDGAKVFIEYSGSGVYTNPFSDDKYRVYESGSKSTQTKSHLLLPHMNLRMLMEFMKESTNSLRIKLNLAMQYASSTYRTSKLIKERLGRLSNSYLLEREKGKLAAEGGIRNDNLEGIKDLVAQDAMLQSESLENAPILELEHLDHSSLAELHKMITLNGGSLYLYDVPLASVEAQIHSSAKAMQNRLVFERWISLKGIDVLKVDGFSYDDSDFPDARHLSIDRRDEFSSMLLKKIEGY